MFLHHYGWALFLLVLKAKYDQEEQNQKQRLWLWIGGHWGHKKNQATSVSSVPFPRGPIICEDFSLFYAGRGCPAGGVVEKVKNKWKLCFIAFSRPYKTPNGSKKKKEIKRNCLRRYASMWLFWHSEWFRAGRADLAQRKTTKTQSETTRGSAWYSLKFKANILPDCVCVFFHWF